jgi:dipeptidase E
MSARPPQIVASGGGGFSTEWGNTLLDDYALSLTGVDRPRVCFLPTASGDADHYVVRFYRAFSSSRCEPSHISLFRRETGVGDPRAHLLAQDLVYVGGGSLVSLLGCWQAHGIDLALREAWHAGVVMCGGSAGSLCWFASALSGFHEGPTRRIRVRRRRARAGGPLPGPVGRAGGGGDRGVILAMGGGGFTMGERSAALDRFILSLTGKPCPRICFLPTASGDPREQLTRFYERFGSWPCELSVLSLFQLGETRLDPVSHLLAQDAIYVGGGSMRNMLAIWREHGIDDAMRIAWHRGIVLAGLSAGAMCWFEAGVSMSGGAPEPVCGLGLLPGSMSAHLHGEPERRPAYWNAVATGALPAGYAADDGAALLWDGDSLVECARGPSPVGLARSPAASDSTVCEALLYTSFTSSRASTDRLPPLSTCRARSIAQRALTTSTIRPQEVVRP